jgi:hypothetical protein
MKLSLFYIALLISLSSCESITEKHLKKLNRKHLYHNDYLGWKLFQVTDDYAVTKTDNDTLKTMRYTIDDNGTPQIYFYEEIFKCGTDTCYLHMRDLDTLFFYSKTGNLRKFKVGEYAFRYMNLKLVDDEIKYYMLYEDSLRKVRGNNLPKLPVLNNEQLKLLNQKYRQL